MPRIPTYARQGFASSYVGAPPVDNSPAILAQGAKGLASIANTIQTQEENTAQTQANSAYYQYQKRGAKVEYGDGTTQGLRDEYANKPKELPDALNTMYDSLAMEIANGLGDEKSKEYFLAKAQKFVGSQQTSWTKSAFDQMQANQVTALDNMGADIAEQASNVTDSLGMTNVLAAIEGGFFGPNVSNIPAADRATMATKYLEQAKENMVASNIAKNPVGFITALQSGEYDKVKAAVWDDKGNKIREQRIFSAKDKQEAMTKAKKMAETYNERAKFNMSVRFGEEGFAASNMLLTTPLPDIDSIRKAKFEAEAIGATKQAEMFDAIEEAALSTREGEAVTDPAWYNRSKAALAAIAGEKEFEALGYEDDQDVPRPLRNRAAKQTPAERIDEIYDYVRDVNRRIADKRVTNKHARDLLAVAQQEVFTNIVKQSGQPSPYFSGMKAIWSKLDIMASDMTPANRDQFKFEILEEYDREIAAMRSTGELDPSAIGPLAGKVLKVAAYRRWPQYANVEVGAPVYTPRGPRKFMGFDENMVPILVLPNADKEALNTR